MLLDLGAVDTEIDAATLAQIVADTAGHKPEQVANVVAALDPILESADFIRQVFLEMGKLLAEEDMLVETLRELMKVVTEKEASSS